MNLHQLPKSTTKSRKRLGRGYSSGKGGHTSSRGQKGQKSRSKIKLWFEGGQLPLSKRLPFLKGKDRFKSLTKNPIVVSLGDLNSLKSGTTVTKDTLVKHGIITLKQATSQPVKVLSQGDFSTPLTFKGLTLSKPAAAKVTKAGGKIVSSDPEPDDKLASNKKSDHKNH